ncbi:hypothetical protein SESBI_32742 [Sesbania bispinosa]|nr:hypothetical protein SESBI_32742 [Sesbania bispinosa]
MTQFPDTLSFPQMPHEVIPLSKMPTMFEIKDALFYYGELEAPGFDGHHALF